MSAECRRWVELSDLEAAGQTLPEEALAFQSAHVAACGECAREAAIWRGVRSPVEPRAVDEHEVDDVLREVLERARIGRLAERRRRNGLVAVGVALSCAAAFALWLRMGAKPSVVAGKDAAPTAALTGTVAGPRAASPAPAHSNAPAAVATCSQPVAGITVCLDSNSEVTARSLDVADRIIELGRGRAVVSLVPQPAGTSFSIGTPTGKVTAVGTVFSVDVAADGTSVARVLHGRVLVRAKSDGIARPLRAGESLRIGADSPAPLSAPERQRDQDLLALSGEVEREAAEPAAPSTVHPTRPAQQEMLEQARALRARGDFAGAAELYRKIHAANPQSPSGLAALVSLGELSLSPLNDAQGALKAFDTYLAHGGALAQEAAFGKARALRALNRPADERRAIERFLASYPDAPQSRVLRHRLSVLHE
jgi:ferric-dicitrate binding protein FerR (iron transport regulator)